MKDDIIMSLEEFKTYMYQRYYENNIERRRKYQREWRKKNKDKVKKYQENYFKKKYEEYLKKVGKE